MNAVGKNIVVGSVVAFGVYAAVLSAMSKGDGSISGAFTHPALICEDEQRVECAYASTGTKFTVLHTKMLNDIAQVSVTSAGGEWAIGWVGYEAVIAGTK